MSTRPLTSSIILLRAIFYIYSRLYSYRYTILVYRVILLLALARLVIEASSSRRSSLLSLI